VADNASVDDSIEVLRKNFPSVELIALNKNYGFAEGYNQALKQVAADYYVLLNSDVEVTPVWIEPIIELMEKDSNVAACQPKILSYHEQDLFEYAGACGGWIDHLGYPFSRGRVFDVCETDTGQYNTAEPIFWASGAAMFIRSKIFHEAGGFDGFFFAHMEEIDLCWRIQLMGYNIMCVPASVVYHIGGGTLPKGNERKVFLNFRNNLIMLAKNLPLSQRLWKMPCRFVLDIISAWKSLFGGEFTYFLAIAEAHYAFFEWLFFHRKKSIFPTKRRASLQGWYRHSIVWKHFVEGKKRFFEITGSKS